MAKYSGKYPQLTEEEVERVVKELKKKVKKNPLDYQAKNRAMRNCKVEARRAFATAVVKDRKVKLRWSVYGVYMRRPEEVPHSKKYFQRLARKSAKLKELLEDLYEAVQAATCLSYE